MKSLIILTSLVISLFGFAGGGGSSSGGGGGGGSSHSSSSSSHSSSRSSSGSGEFSLPVFLATVAIYGGFFVLMIIISKRADDKRTKKQAAEEARLDAIEANFSAKEKWIHDEAKRIFVAYQQDWSDYNLENIRKYTTDRYFEHASLMLDAIDRTGRRNVVKDIEIIRAIFQNEFDANTKTPISIPIMFKFDGIDTIEDVKDKSLINIDEASDVIEYWNFVYDGESLKLDGIVQSTESTPHLLEGIANFSNENGLFYSPDWGRLALPTNGLIFPGSSILSIADVNNHVVGKWKDCLVQMYTYSATPGLASTYYIVGQINVKKRYEGVIVESKAAKLKVKKPKGYEKFEFEWNDFNKRYTVYASSKDALPAFELLNPGFMEKLYAKNLPYNLEVKDNAIYIFAKVKSAKEEDYKELFDILSEAYKELKI